MGSGGQKTSVRGVKHYVIKLVIDLQLVGRLVYMYRKRIKLTPLSQQLNFDNKHYIMFDSFSMILVTLFAEFAKRNILLE